MSSFHLIEQCRHTQNKTKMIGKKSEIQHAQSNERERLLVHENCTVVLFCANNRTYKRKNNRCTEKKRYSSISMNLKPINRSILGKYRNGCVHHRVGCVEDEELVVVEG